MIVQTPVKFSGHRVEQVIRFDPLSLRNLRDGLQSCARTFKLRQRHGPVQPHDGRGLESIKFLVATENVGPVGRRVILRRAIDMGVYDVGGGLFFKIRRTRAATADLTVANCRQGWRRDRLIGIVVPCP